MVYRQRWTAEGRTHLSAEQRGQCRCRDVAGIKAIGCVGGAIVEVVLRLNAAPGMLASAVGGIPGRWSSSVFYV